MSLFGRSQQKGSDAPIGPPVDPIWARDSRGRFHRFLPLDPEEEGLNGKGGVFVIWHAGMQPAWVYVGQSEDLAGTLHMVGNDKDILSFEVNGGLFVTWSFVLKEFRNGVVRYLEETLHPLVPTQNDWPQETQPVAVFSPGSEPKNPNA